MVTPLFRLGRRVLLAGLALGLGACANPADIAPGTPLAELEARLGKPDFTCTTAQGLHRVIWTMQPFGQHAWGATIQADGRAGPVEAVLTSAYFRRLGEGSWTRETVLCEFGPPAESGPIGLPGARQEVWSYRFKENGVWDSLMHVYFDPHTGKLMRHHPGPDPMYEPIELMGPH